MPRLVEILKGGEGVSHEQSKGALYLIIGAKGKSLLIKHNWNTFSLYPAVIEKETVVHNLETHHRDQVQYITVHVPVYLHLQVQYRYSTVQYSMVVHHLETHHRAQVQYITGTSNVQVQYSTVW